jgi:hypothetical protein
MTYGKRRSRKDEAEDDIVKALEGAGCEVWVIEHPVDLLTLYRGRWQPLEVKTGKYRPRKDQAEQTVVLQRTQIPVVTTPLEALKAIGAM